MTATMRLEHAFAYVSALLNAQLALDYVRAHTMREPASPSTVVVVLVPIVTFFAGVIITLGVVAGYLAAAKASRTQDANIVRFGKNQIGIVIDASEQGVVKGAHHQVEPPTDAPPTVGVAV